MVMPGMTGKELAQRMQQLRSGFGVIYMSGYSEQSVSNSGQGDATMHLLTKPFSRGRILHAVREALSGVRAS
jgi:FixJ family two-component response regulator